MVGLIAKATAAGLKLSRSEIQYRLQAARTYPTEDVLCTAGAQYESWTELREAKFPAVEGGLGVVPDVVGGDVPAPVNPAPHGEIELTLFPWPLQARPLREAALLRQAG